MNNIQELINVLETRLEELEDHEKLYMSAMDWEMLKRFSNLTVVINGERHRDHVGLVGDKKVYLY